MASIRERLVRAFAPAGGFRAVLVTGSGTAAVETAVGSVLSEHGRLVIAANGVYGERMAEMAAAARLSHTVVRGEWTAPPDVTAVERALLQPHVEALAVVHNETTTGLRTPLEDLGALARRHGQLLLVDSVSGLAGDPLDLDAVDADLVAGTSGKCIQAFPGMGFVLVRESAWERLRANPRRSVYLSLATYGESPLPFTPAVQVGYAFDEALGELLEEGVANRIARYASAAALLRAGFERLGLACILPPALRCNTITSLGMPAGHTYTSLHDGLKERGFVIYEGQGRLRSEVVRVCNMGHLGRADFERFLVALGDVLA
jgi:2-aminoethylphosphonate-pyruvate transaminase